MEERLEALADHLGKNIRQIREARGLTQQGLANLADVPRSTVANVETGVSNPTLSVLARLASSLQLSLEELLSPPRGRCEVFPKGSLPIRSRRGGAEISKLLPHAIPGMEIDRMELERGGRMTGAPHRPGTHEYLCCERGRLVLRVMGERFELGPGDVAAFPGDQAHSYENVGNGPAVGFSVVTLAPL